MVKGFDVYTAYRMGLTFPQKVCHGFLCVVSLPKGTLLMVLRPCSCAQDVGRLIDALIEIVLTPSRPHLALSLCVLSSGPFIKMHPSDPLAALLCP